MRDGLDNKLPSWTARVTLNEYKCGRTGARRYMHSTSTSHGKPYTPHAVDNADWLRTAASISVSVGHFRLSPHGRRPLVERFRTPGVSDVFLPSGLRADPDRPAPLDLARSHADCARNVERRLDPAGATQ